MGAPDHDIIHRKRRIARIGNGEGLRFGPTVAQHGTEIRTVGQQRRYVVVRNVGQVGAQRPDVGRDRFGGRKDQTDIGSRLVDGERAAAEGGSKLIRVDL